MFLAKGYQQFTDTIIKPHLDIKCNIISSHESLPYDNASITPVVHQCYKRAFLQSHLNQQKSLRCQRLFCDLSGTTGSPYPFRP